MCNVWKRNLSKLGAELMPCYQLDEILSTSRIGRLGSCINLFGREEVTKNWGVVTWVKKVYNRKIAFRLEDILQLH
jgi:hypothetical protein